MEFIFDNERPIYLQLVEQLRNEIISGRLKQGEKIPSVREFALLSKVNPNTVQKALAELEREKLIYTERTNGKFVTTDESFIKKIRQDTAKERIEVFISDMQILGITKEEIDKLWKERND